MIAAILLAAGESSRMGQPKQLLDWHGEPLIVAQIEALLEVGCGPVVVVLGAHQHRLKPLLPSRSAVQITTNRNWREGRASSIRTGARAVSSAHEAVVVASVDQPVSPAVVRELCSVIERAPGAMIVVPRYEGTNGHPPIFRSELLPELQSVTERQEGLRAIRRRHAERTIFLETDDPIVTLNLNTPDAYRSALAFSNLHKVRETSESGERILASE